MRPGWSRAELRCPATVHERQVGDVTILDIDGRITIQDGADIFRAVVRQLVALSRVKLALNLQNVPYIDTTALGEIIRAHLSVTRRNGRLTFVPSAEACSGAARDDEAPAGIRSVR